MDLTATILLLLLAAVWGGVVLLCRKSRCVRCPPLTITLHRVFWALPILMLIVYLQKIAGAAFPAGLGLLSCDGCTQQRHSVFPDLLGADADWKVVWPRS